MERRNKEGARGNDQQGDELTPFLDTRSLPSDSFLNDVYNDGDKLLLFTFSHERIFRSVQLKFYDKTGKYAN